MQNCGFLFNSINFREFPFSEDLKIKKDLKYNGKHYLIALKSIEAKEIFCNTLHYKICDT